MSESATKSDPTLWERIKAAVTAGDKGGKAGQWSARKAQMATTEYKKQGGGYVGRRATDNHLKQWTEEEWGTKSGKDSGETGERYLPKAARSALTEEEYDRSTRTKRIDTAEGRQHSQQPADVAQKTAAARAEAASGPRGRGSQGPRIETKAELLARARDRGVAGRSTMSKAELVRALQD